MPKKKDLEKIAKEQGIPQPKGEPDIPKRPPRGGIAGELDDLESQVGELKKALRSEKARAESFRRYRDKEQEHGKKILAELRRAEKARDDAKDRVRELENPLKKKTQVIRIGGQTHWRNNREDARNLVKNLIDDGIWYFSVGEEER